MKFLDKICISSLESNVWTQYGKSCLIETFECYHKSNKNTWLPGVVQNMPSLFHHFDLAGQFEKKTDTTHQQIKDYFGKNQDGMRACMACGCLQRSHSGLKFHVESKHFSPGYPCKVCGKILLHQRDYVKHIKSAQNTEDPLGPLAQCLSCKFPSINDFNA